MLKNILMIVLLVVLTPFVAIAQEAGLDPLDLVGQIVALILDNLGSTGLAIAGVIGMVATAAAMLPNRSKLPWLGAVLRVLNTVGMNVGKSKNDPKIG